MMARLVVEEGDLTGLILSFDEGDSWIIGRDPDECQLVIEDPLTSRKHLIARRLPDGIQVENLSATNPILVNDEDLGGEPRLLQQGDLVKIGNEIFRFYTDTNAQIMDESTSRSKASSSQDRTNDHDPDLASITSLTLMKNSHEKPPTDGQAIPNSTPPTTIIPPTPNLEEEFHKDTLFEDDDADSIFPFAQINFGITETGRWLLKVIGGPNNGAEFYMQAGHSYILGTDPHTCDIIFHDTSVSRQHAKISVTPDDTIQIEDLKSRNGVLVSGIPLEGKQSLSPSVIVTIGTTSFVIYDREGEMQTIISPLLPSIVKVLQNEEAQKEEKNQPQPPIVEAPVEEPLPPPKPQHGHLVLLAIITGVFLLAGITTASLFRSEPIVERVQVNATELVQQALAPYPAVRFSYNKSTDSLLLLGHVATAADKNQLLYSLQGLTFIKSIDDSGIVIDEFVWQEINSVLSKNAAWRGITIHSPEAGQFILSGYLATRAQAEQLSDYISVNFPYLDLLKKQIVVEEDVLSQISVWLQEESLRNVTAKLSNGEISLTGRVPTAKAANLDKIVTKIKGIPGVRSVNDYVESEAPELDVINISSNYEVTGQSRTGEKYTVIINGRILTEGDALDGMVITSVKPNQILLEKGTTKYRIDYNK
jgi:type III secretion system YscD/HrpQ family protein